MERALRPGTIVLTRPRWGRIRRGAVVVAVGPSGTRVIKRVIGVPGDRVQMEVGHLRVNGHWWAGEPASVGAAVATWVVPPGHYFLVGDNAGASTDSRVWAEPFIRHTAIVGVVVSRRARRARAGRGSPRQPR